MEAPGLRAPSRGWVKAVHVALFATTALLVWFDSAAGADAASLTITVGPNPTAGESVSITVHGASAGTDNLYVTIGQGFFYTCPGTPSAAGDSDGTTVPGSFSETYSYTPPTANQTYVVCGYLDQSASDTPDAQASTSFTAAPAATVQIGVGSTNPTVGQPLSITITGSSPATDNLYAYVDAVDVSCPSTPSEINLSDGGAPLADGVHIAGSFSEAYSYTPTMGVGLPDLVCAYVDQGSSETPEAEASISFVPTGTPPSDNSLPKVGGTPIVGRRLTASVGRWSGTTPITYLYQWQKCARACKDLDGATGSSYVIGSNTVGDSIRVVVTAGNAAGSGDANSPQTTSVLARICGRLPCLFNGGDFLVKPAIIFLNRSLTQYLGGRVFLPSGRLHRDEELSWAVWNSTRAFGVGYLWIDNCRPACANGTYHSHAAVIVADRVRSHVFTRLTVYYSLGNRYIHKTYPLEHT